jgi:hypothetical protein
VLGQHFFGMAARHFGDLGATGHAGNFVDALGKIEGAKLRRRLPGLFGFVHPIVLIPVTGDLGQVGDAKNLVRAGDAMQLFAHHAGGLTSDAGIDFVKDQRRHLVFTRQHAFQSEHDP